jgi:hypothetical protein
VLYLDEYKLRREDMTTKTRSLIPNGKQLMEAGLNVLLIGKHGTGKTMTVLQIAKELGYKIKVFSCATLDPFTELCGVPVPRMREDGREDLKMIRPLDLDDCDGVFLDEFNRARPEVRDAVLEFIQFGSINGEKLPNLKFVWAAMNPAESDQNYQVDVLDPALIDRFDQFIEFAPKPNVAYMSQYMPKSVAQALVSWWRDHNKKRRQSYISPRRLEKIGRIFMITQDKRSVVQSLPPDGTYDSNKLFRMLDEALNPDKYVQSSGELGDKAADGFDFSRPSKLVKDIDRLAKYLKDNPKSLETHKKVVECLKGGENINGVGSSTLLKTWSPVLNNLNKPMLESLFGSFSSVKRSALVSSMNKLIINDPDKVVGLGNVYQAIREAKPTNAYLMHLDDGLAVGHIPKNTTQKSAGESANGESANQDAVWTFLTP